MEIKYLQKPLKKLDSSKDLVRQFVPSWFGATMGTGILAVLIHDFPFPFKNIFYLGWAYWWLNVFLFVVFTIMFACRWIFFFKDALLMLHHPLESMFLGTIPMSLSTIVEGLAVFCVPIFGSPAIILTGVLWYVNVALALLSATIVPIYMIHAHEHSLETMTAVWVLPVIPPEVAAGAGGVILSVIENIESARYVAFISAILWGMSVPIAMSILVVFFLRLVVYKLPSNDLIASCWLPLGPIGSAALTATGIGLYSHRIFTSSDIYDKSLVFATASVGIWVGCVFGDMEYGGLLWPYLP
eukprot:jgi/Galph1/4842/GphlegSOOS_G3484.1